MHRLRGVLGTAITWALVWLPIGLVLVLFRKAQFSECLYCEPYWLLRMVAYWMEWGALSGAIFALMLMIAERRHSLSDLSVRRTAVWGAVSAMALPAATVVAEVIQWPGISEGWSYVGLYLAVAALLGAGCAAGTLTLARRAPS